MSLSMVNADAGASARPDIIDVASDDGLGCCCVCNHGCRQRLVQTTVIARLWDDEIQ
jgi:hypothetical protein